MTADGAPVPTTTFFTVTVNSEICCAPVAVAVSGTAASASAASNEKRRTIRTGLPSRKNAEAATTTSDATERTTDARPRTVMVGSVGLHQHLAHEHRVEARARPCGRRRRPNGSHSRRSRSTSAGTQRGEPLAHPEVLGERAEVARVHADDRARRSRARVRARRRRGSRPAPRARARRASSCRSASTASSGSAATISRIASAPMARVS